MQATALVPKVFHMSDASPGAHGPLSRSWRIVTPDSTGSTKLFAGMFWAQPGSSGGFSFEDRDPRLDNITFVGPCDEVYFVLQGRVRVEWSGGEFEYAGGDVVYFPSGHTYRTTVMGQVPVNVFYVMAPPGLLPPLTSLGEQ